MKMSNPFTECAYALRVSILMNIELANFMVEHERKSKKKKGIPHWWCDKTIDK